MKTRMNQLAAAIFALLLVAGNVAFAEGITKASDHEFLTNEIVAEEPALKLEDWMTNPEIWKVNVWDFTAEKESEIKLEDWMKELISWTNVSDFSAHKESKLELEDWMLDENTWNVFLLQPEEKENGLEIEPWMVNEDIWKVNS